MTFIFGAREEDAPWQIEAPRLALKALSMVEENPFCKMEEMDFDYLEKWRKYDRAQALRELISNSDAGLTFRGFEPYYLSFALARHDWYNVISCHADLQYLKNSKMPAETIDFLKKWLDIFPKFYRAEASADNRDNDYFLDELEILRLPRCFSPWLCWYQIVHPRVYHEFFEPEDLRDAPFYKIEELSDGALGLTAYEHPLEFATAENTRRIVEITNYLNDRRKDWQE